MASLNDVANDLLRMSTPGRTYLPGVYGDELGRNIHFEEKDPETGRVQRFRLYLDLIEVDPMGRS